MSAGGLVDREREFEAIEHAAAAGRGQLVVVWGRRRVGNRYLLQAFSERHRTIYDTATQQSAPIELAAFTDAVRASLGTEGLPAGYVFPDWSIALDFVTDGATEHEIDIVGVSGRGVGFIGEAKWSARPLSAAVLRSLDAHAAALPGIRPATPRLLYGRTGCALGLEARFALQCYSASDLYAE